MFKKISIIICVIILFLTTGCSVKSLPDDTTTEQSSQTNNTEYETETLENDIKVLTDKYVYLNEQNLYDMNINFNINMSSVEYMEIDEIDTKILFSFFIDDGSCVICLVNPTCGDVEKTYKFDRSKYTFITPLVHSDEYGTMEINEDGQIIVVKNNTIYAKCRTVVPDNNNNNNNVKFYGTILTLDSNLKPLKQIELSEDSAFCPNKIDITLDGKAIVYVDSINKLCIWNIVKSQLECYCFDDFTEIDYIRVLPSGVYMDVTDNSNQRMSVIFDENNSKYANCDNVYKQKIYVSNTTALLLNNDSNDIDQFQLYTDNGIDNIVLRDQIYGVNLSSWAVAGLSFDNSIGMLKLNYYDLNDMERKYEEYYAYIIRDDAVLQNTELTQTEMLCLNDCNWVVITIKNGSDLRVLLWDIDGKLSTTYSYNTEKEKFIYGISANADESSINSLIKNIENEYGVRIFTDDSQFGNITKYQPSVSHNNEIIYNAINILECELKKYPPNFFKVIEDLMGKKISISLVSYISQTVTGCCNDNNIFLNIVDQDYNETIHHEIAHAIHIAINYKCGTDWFSMKLKSSEYDSELIQDFNNDGYITWKEVCGNVDLEYGNLDSKTEYDDIITNGSNSSFIRAYAENSCDDDWACTMEYAFYDDWEYQLLYNLSDVISNKLWFIDMFIKYTLLNNDMNSNIIWEHMLMAPDMYGKGYWNGYSYGITHYFSRDIFQNREIKLN